MSTESNLTAYNLDRQILWSHRIIPPSYSDHVPGRVPWTPPPQSIAVESGLEAHILHRLIEQPQVLYVHSQPFTLSYLDEGKLRRYTPDFLVVLERVNTLLRRLGFALWTVVEIKTSDYYGGHRAEVQQRLQYVRDLLGFGAVCLTERHLPAEGA